MPKWNPEFKDQIIFQVEKDGLKEVQGYKYIKSNELSIFTFNQSEYISKLNNDININREDVVILPTQVIGNISENIVLMATNQVKDELSSDFICFR